MQNRRTIVRTIFAMLIGLSVFIDPARADLRKAVRDGDWVQVEQLLDAQPAQVNQIDAGYSGYSILHVACESAPDDVVAMLLKRGAAINAADKYGLTPLQVAVDREREGIVEQLISNKVDVTIADKYGVTPLHRATGRQNVAIIDKLLEAGANVDAPAKAIHEDLSDADTPLLIAVKAGDFKTTQHLVEKGAKVNRADKQGRTPLHMAALYGNSEMVEFLIKSKADVNAKTKRGVTPLGMARATTGTSCIEILKQQGAKEGVPFNEEMDRPLRLQ